MNLFDVAINNLRRRKGKAAFILVGLLTGIVTAVTLISLSDALTMKAMHNMENFGANIVITPVREDLTLSYGGISLGQVSVASREIDESQLEEIYSIPNSANIAIVAPKVLGGSTLNGHQIIIMGVDPEKEFLIKRWWTVNGPGITRDDEVVIGSAIASRLNLAVADVVKIGDMNFKVGGILASTGSQDDELTILTLGIAQEILGKAGVLTMVEVAALCGDCPVEDMVSQIQKALPTAQVSAIQQVVKSRMHALDQFRMLSYAVSAVVIFVGAMIVFVTMMSSVADRTREIGIFRAIGFRQSQVLSLFLIEATIISFIAGLLGFVGGIGLAWLIYPLFSDGGGAIPISSTLFVGAMALSLLTGIGATFYPALKAGRMDPNSALRSL